MAVSQMKLPTKPEVDPVIAAMIGRMALAIKAKGLEWKTASLATTGPRGRRLGATFVRDAIIRQTARPDYLECVCRDNKISWDYVKLNKGPPPPGVPKEASPPPAEKISPADAVLVDPAVLADLITGICHLLGATHQLTDALVERALATIRDKKS